MTEAGLKDIYKGFNLSGDALVDAIENVPPSRRACARLVYFRIAERSQRYVRGDREPRRSGRPDFRSVRLADAVSGDDRFRKVGSGRRQTAPAVDGVPLTQHWLIPERDARSCITKHPTMTLEEIRVKTQGAWDDFYSWRRIWKRSNVVKSLKARVAFVLISKLYRQMYANTGIATDSARVSRSARWARLTGGVCRRLFLAKPMPDLQVPQPNSAPTVATT